MLRTYARNRTGGPIAQTVGGRGLIRLRLLQGDACQAASGLSVVAYRTSGWSYAIARRLVRIPDIALVNIVAGRRIVPELVQGAVTPDALADQLLPLLDPRSEARRTQVAALAEVRGKLGEPGAARRAAGLASELVG